jgi:hypothetical protein
LKLLPCDSEWRRRTAARPAAHEIHDEIELVKQTAGTLDDYSALTAEVLLLLLYGSKTDSTFKVTAESLERVIPHATRIGLPGA